MIVTAALYHGETLLAQGRCSLLPERMPTDGAFIGATDDLLTYQQLTLVTSAGQKLTIAPKRLETRAGGKPLLVFTVVGSPAPQAPHPTTPQ